MSRSVRYTDFALCFIMVFISFTLVNNEAVNFFVICFLMLRSFHINFFNGKGYLCGKGTLRDCLLSVLLTYGLYPSLTLLRHVTG